MKSVKMEVERKVHELVKWRFKKIILNGNNKVWMQKQTVPYV